MELSGLQSCKALLVVCSLQARPALPLPFSHPRFSAPFSHSVLTELFALCAAPTAAPDCDWDGFAQLEFLPDLLHYGESPRWWLWVYVNLPPTLKMNLYHSSIRAAVSAEMAVVWYMISLVHFKWERLLVIFIMLFISQSSNTQANRSMPKREGRTTIGNRLLQSCDGCGDHKDINITTTYVDTTGAFHLQTVKSRDLSASWIWMNRTDKTSEGQKYMGKWNLLKKDGSNLEQQNQTTAEEYPHSQLSLPVKIQRQKLRQRRRELRTAGLLIQDTYSQKEMERATIEHSVHFDSIFRGQYSIWRRELKNPHSDSILKLMRDQIIMAKVYASIARSVKETNLYDSLIQNIRESQQAIEEVDSDAELPMDATIKAKEMGHVLSSAKVKLHGSAVMARKLRVMVQSAEENLNVQKKRDAFLIQLAAKTIPRGLHCLPLHLTTDYYLHYHKFNKLPNSSKLEDPSLYHYAIFSDNVLATSVVVNSTVFNAKQPEEHVFHIVTDKLNFIAMKMWFLLHHPPGATIHVENIEEFKWLNSSYCSVLRQLESARLKEYYFKMNHPSSLTAGLENLKYRNPKYLSMLNHLRFYMPEIYPKLDKILFLDDDVVVQRDLTPLWSIHLKGMVNGAVETCKESFHRFETYLNFSNPKISQNFDPRSCGWAFGMNMFDLKQWKQQNITGIYHYWQDLNEDRTLWKLGSLPPGLITFYNLTYALDRNWHVLGLGYDPAVDLSTIKNAAVIHYNGNYKPWLDLAVNKYRKYWTKYVMFDNPYLQRCHINQS